REEAHAPEEVRPANAADLAARAAADGDQHGQGEGEHDHDGRQDDQQDQVVREGLEEGGVLEERDVVVQADELRGRCETAPVGQRVVDRLRDRPHDDHEVEQQRQPQEHREEEQTRRGDPRPRPPAARRGGRGGGSGYGCHHSATSNFSMLSSSRTASISPCSRSRAWSAVRSPLRNSVHSVTVSGPSPYQARQLKWKVTSPAAVIISSVDASAVEPKASSGIVSLRMVTEEVISEKFCACSLESMIRRNSRPPAPFAASLGTKNGSPAVPWMASAGMAEPLLSCGVGTPTIS